VGEPLGEVALVEVAGADPVPDEFLHRVFMIRGQSFTPASRTPLVAGRYAGIGEPCERLRRGGGDLRRVVEVGIHPERVVARKHRHELLRDPVGRTTGTRGFSRMGAASSSVTAPPIEIGGIQGFSAQRLQSQSHNIDRRILVAVHRGAHNVDRYGLD